MGLFFAQYFQVIMFRLEFEAPLEKHDSSLGWYYIIYVPLELISEFGTEKNPRAKVTFNKKEVAHISVKSKGDDRFVVIKSKLRTNLGLVVGELTHVIIEKDDSKFGMPMPEEFGEMLAQEEEAERYFNALTPGKQRSLIYMVSQLKNSEPRVKKALAIIEHLKEQQGELDFRVLNQKIKEVNNRFKSI